MTNDSLFAGVGDICEAAMRRARADGAALAVLSRSALSRELIYATDSLAQQLDELQYTIGEGPCFDAYLDDRPQFHPELTSIAQTSRWPTFAADATQLGARALFAFPVPDGQRPVGVLELYRRRVGNLDAAECTSVVTYTAMIGQRLLSNWEHHVVRFGGVERALDAAATAGVALSEAANPFTRTQIHIAGGMVAIQLGVDADEGVDRLRAYSYASGRRLSSIAADIIARRLTLHA
ncbi:MAG: GAF domain-containing protein [Mycobacterium sp.]